MSFLGLSGQDFAVEAAAVLFQDLMCRAWVHVFQGLGLRALGDEGFGFRPWVYAGILAWHDVLIKQIECRSRSR